MKLNILLIFTGLCLMDTAAAIPDMEPDVTAQVAEVLEAVADGKAAAERFTERGAAISPRPACLA